MKSPFTWDIDVIGDDCYDVFVSEDDGETWEYYDSYGNESEAIEAGRAAVKRAEKNDGFMRRIYE